MRTSPARSLPVDIVSPSPVPVRAVASRSMPTWAAVAVRTVLVASSGLLFVTLTPTTAAACDASYGTKPTVSFGGGDSLFGGTCSTGTSLTGAFVVALLAVAALVLLARLAFQKGEAAAASWAAASASDASADPGVADQALASYLGSVGLRDDTAPPPSASPQPLSPDRP